MLLLASHYPHSRSFFLSLFTMVKFALKFKAELDNITNLQPLDTPQDPFEYTFKIECTSCREQHPKPVTINQYENHEMSGSRGEASFVFKCKLCKNEHNASIERTKEIYDSEKSGNFVTLLTIDARGIDFNEFVPIGHFECYGLDEKTKFSQVELEDGEWYDYDDNAGTEVSITETEWSIERI